MTTGLTYALHDPDNGSIRITPVSRYNEEENEGERMFRMGVVASVLADRQEAKKKERKSDTTATREPMLCVL